MVGSKTKTKLLASISSLEARVVALEAEVAGARENEANENKYRNLFDNALVGMYRTSMTRGQILAVNAKWARILGYASPEEVIGRVMVRDHYVNPTDRDRLIETLLREGRVESFIVAQKRVDGTRFWAELSAQLYPEKDYLEGTVVDVTERLHMAEALQRSEKRYRNLFDNITDYIMTHDLKGRLTEVNPAACQALGLPAEELIGRPISDFIVPKFRDMFLEDYMEEIGTKGRAEGIMQILGPDGHPRYLEYHNLLLTAEDTEPYVISSTRDVTDKIMAQRELRHMEEQLAQAQKMEAVGTLASGISHDFNNILQAISGYVQVLLEKIRDRETRKELLEIDLAVGRAVELIRRLLTFSRKLPPSFIPVNLNRQIGLTAAMLERTIPKMIRIETRLAPDLAWINSDPAQMEQILLNLATNARDAMPDGGILTIGTENWIIETSSTVADLKPGPYVRLWVSDTGTGMTPDIVDRIFEPFFTTKPMGEGTGLGLSTVYALVRQHGGRISCESRPGRGTTFVMFFPARLAAEAEPIPPAQAVVIVGGNETILVVDDEKSIIEVTMHLLQTHGYLPVPAESGEKALQALQALGRRIDLVILDLGMPGMGGLACLKELTRIRPDLKVIIASGYSAGGQMKKALEAGALDFIAKPYRMRDLLLKVRTVLDQPRST